MLLGKGGRHRKRMTPTRDRRVHHLTGVYFPRLSTHHHASSPSFLSGHSPSMATTLNGGSDTDPAYFELDLIVYCAVCFRPLSRPSNVPGSGMPFWLTSCGHVACADHMFPGGGEEDLLSLGRGLSFDGLQLPRTPEKRVIIVQFAKTIRYR